MSIEEFRFKVEPKEDLVTREERWDAELLKLQSRGLTIKGTGPDNDYPVRYAFSADGEMTFEEWWKGNPDEPWYEVYNLVPLADLERELAEHADSMAEWADVTLSAAEEASRV